jgi:tetratricopeptide (TPR) repeat protein
MFVAEAERAVALNPNDAMTVLYMGHYMALMGQWERGLALVNKAIALNPRGPHWQTRARQWHHMYLREFEKALLISNTVGGDDYQGWMIRASLLGHLGRADDAEFAIANLQRVFPGFTVELAREQAEKRNFLPELTTILVEGLGLAGLDIPDEPAAAN